MAELTITKKLGDLKVLFNKIKEVYYIKETDKTPNAVTSVDMEFPVVSDGVTFNTGEASVTKVKLTTGETWTSMPEAGDSDISFQVATVADDVNELFLNKVDSQEVTLGASVNGYTYKGFGYNLEPKKVTGGLMMLSEDRQTQIFLPNVEMYASLLTDQSKPAYYNVAVTPLASKTGQAIYILKGSLEA